MADSDPIHLCEKKYKSKEPVKSSFVIIKKLLVISILSAIHLLLRVRLLLLLVLPGNTFSSHDFSFHILLLQTSHSALPHQNQLWLISSENLPVFALPAVVD